MTQAYAQLLEHVHAFGAAWRTRRVLSGLTLCASVFVAALLAAGVTDRLVGGRGPLALLLWTATLLAGWRCVVRPWRFNASDDYLARLIELRLPAASLKNRLVNAVQLGRDPSAGSPRLVEAIVHEGVRTVEEVDLSPATGSDVQRRHSIALAMALAALAALLLLWGPPLRTSVMRVLLPWAPIPPFTWTLVRAELESGKSRVLEGTPVTVRATTQRRPASAALLRWGDGAIEMRPQATPGSFAATLTGDAVTKDLELFVEAGDGRSAPLRLTVDPLPRVEKMTALLTPPSYTGLPALSSDSDGHLRGLPGSTVLLTVTSSKDLHHLEALMDEPPAFTAHDARTWSATFSLRRAATYRLSLRDTQGYTVTAPLTYTLTLDRDAPPTVGFVHPARDLQVAPGARVSFALAATDDLGLGEVSMLGRINPRGVDDSPPTVLHHWPRDGAPRKRLDLRVDTTVTDLGLKPGDRLEYWALARDRNDVSDSGPGQARSRSFHLIVLSPEQAAQQRDAQLAQYAAAVEELLRLQRLNRTQTAGGLPAVELTTRQGVIRRQTLTLSQRMERDAFPAISIIEQLRQLANDQMPRVITLLENGAAHDQTLETQDRVIASLEQILARLTRVEQTRAALRKMQRDQPTEHQRTLETLARTAADLDKFLSEVKELNERYERLPKRPRQELTGETAAQLSDIQTRLDRWKQWARDTVDEITKLPDGFVNDSHLADNVSTIFEEIEKKQRAPTVEIATPVEEGAKSLAEQTAEDFEMWMPDAGDNLKWVMEDPLEGTFKVPESKLPESLQDMVGDLIEKLDEFDEEADDTTGAWGGNFQMGWLIADGPISSYNATGKTGNQMPNASEMGGRSGAGRRGRSSGQMVGAESPGYEGRPTPARVTNERYEEGNVAASKQLDPRGATGGGKKTGQGRRGLQGGTPPDFQRTQVRMEQTQALLREQAQQVARELDAAGRPSLRVQRAMELLETAQADLRDLRYEDAARQRKAALGELRAEQAAIDQAVSLTLQRGADVPPELRQQILAGSRGALPEGYEQMVGDYFKALAQPGESENP